MSEDTPTPEPQDPQELPEGAQQPDAVLVPVTYNEDGAVQVEVHRLGTVRVTEVATILEQALRNVRAQLGLAG